MKTLTLTLRAGLLGVAFCLITSGVRAEGAEKPAEKPVPPGVLKKFDKDGDGKLSDEERSAWKAARDAEKKSMLEKYDTDKDGKLSDEEKAAAKAEREKGKKKKSE